MIPKNTFKVTDVLEMADEISKTFWDLVISEHKEIIKESRDNIKKGNYQTFDSFLNENENI